MTAHHPRWLALLVALVAAHLLATAWLTPRGHLNVDECTYHVMARAAQEGRLAHDNGYDEYPSPELAWVTLKPHAGQLFPITPPFYAAVAWPFYRAFGLAGLFWMNALAWLVVLGLTGRFAFELFRDRALALTAVAILGFCTYLWEYSQGAWPHVLATLAVLAALAWAWRGLQAENEAVGWRACVAAGLCLGLGVGVRLDVALAAPALGLPFLFAPPGRARRALALALGALPPLLLLTFINHSKFGVAFPFSYGATAAASGDWTRYLAPLAVGLAGVGGVRLLGAARVRQSARARHAVWAALALAALAALALAPLREPLLRLASGATTLLVDLRALPHEIVRPALSRSSGDGLVYFGHLKKAWLQSLPYLGLLVLPLLAALRGHADRAKLALLAAVPVSLLAAFGYFAWDGGLALNLRYLTPALPCVAILVAWALRALDARHAGVALGVGAWSAAALFWGLSRTRGATPDTAELFVLDTPLVLAAAVTAAALWWAAARSAAARRLACGFAAAGLTWAALAAFAYDYPAVRWLRGYHAELSQAALATLAPDSLLFTTHPDPFCGLLGAERVRIALPLRDDYADFRSLAEFHLAAGRPVYAALPRGEWQRLQANGRLAGFDVEPLHEHPIFVIGRLRD